MAREDGSTLQILLVLKDAQAGRSRLHALLAEHRIPFTFDREKDFTLGDTLATESVRRIVGAPQVGDTREQQVLENNRLVVETSAEHLVPLLKALRDDTRHFQSLVVSGAGARKMPRELFRSKSRESVLELEQFSGTTSEGLASSKAKQLEDLEPAVSEDLVPKRTDLAKGKTLKLVLILQAQPQTGEDAKAVPADRGQ